MSGAGCANDGSRCLGDCSWRPCEKSAGRRQESRRHKRGSSGEHDHRAASPGRAFLKSVSRVPEKVTDAREQVVPERREREGQHDPHWQARKKAVHAVKSGRADCRGTDPCDEQESTSRQVTGRLRDAGSKASSCTAAGTPAGAETTAVRRVVASLSYSARRDQAFPRPIVARSTRCAALRWRDGGYAFHPATDAFRHRGHRP